MRKYQLNPQAPNALVMMEGPRPVPRRGQVLVQMKAASLNFRDLALRDRIRSGSSGLAGRIPLSDGVGEIVALGDEVIGHTLGATVAGCFYQTWLSGHMLVDHLETALGGTVDGMLAEFVVLDTAGMVVVPDFLTPLEAACLPCAGVTAWNALSGASAGDVVLVKGTGGVALAAVQIGVGLGCTVICTTTNTSKAERLRILGANAVIDARSRDWAGKVRSLTANSAGVDRVVETVGGADLQESMRACRHGGTIALVGVLDQGEVNPVPLIFHSLTVRGVQVGSRQHFLDLLDFLGSTGIRPIVDRVFPFKDAEAAYAYLASGRHIGKVIIEF